MAASTIYSIPGLSRPTTGDAINVIYSRDIRPAAANLVI